MKVLESIDAENEAADRKYHEEMQLTEEEEREARDQAEAEEQYAKWEAEDEAENDRFEDPAELYEFLERNPEDGGFKDLMDNPLMRRKLNDQVELEIAGGAANNRYSTCEAAVEVNRLKSLIRQREGV